LSLQIESINKRPENDGQFRHVKSTKTARGHDAILIGIAKDFDERAIAFLHSNVRIWDGVAVIKLGQKGKSLIG
jgi:hypothetical protein